MFRYNIHDLLKIESNASLDIPKIFNVNNIENVDLSVNVGRFSPDFFGEVNDVYCFESGSTLLRFKFHISDLFGKTKIACSGPMGFVRKQTINNMTKTVISWKLLMKNHALIYGDCLEKDGEGFLILGPSGIGKTLTSIFLITQHGFNYLGNDEIILSKDNVAYSYHIFFKIHPEHLHAFKLALSAKEKIIFHLRNNLRQLPYFNGSISQSFVDVNRLPCNVNIRKSVKIKRIYWLEKNGNEIEEIERESVLNKYLSLNLYYWWRLWSKSYPLYKYLIHSNNKAYVGDLVAIMEQTIKHSFDNSRCFVVKDNHKNWYSKIVQEFD